jgi:hypothetical protein
MGAAARWTRAAVRGLAHDATFLRLPGADKIADHDQARADADAHLERLLCHESANSVDEH